MTRAELITAIEAATGPSVELDVAIWQCVGATVIPFEMNPMHWVSRVADGPWFRVPRFGKGGSTSDGYVLPYTASIDAALTLVPEGYSIMLLAIVPGKHTEGLERGLGYLPGKKPIARVWSSDGGQTAEAATPALAICAAALRASADKGE